MTTRNAFDEADGIRRLRNTPPRQLAQWQPAQFGGNRTSRAGQSGLNAGGRFLALARATITWAICASFVTASLAREDAVQKSIEESRKVAMQVSREMNSQLLREMQLSGPVRSLLVCKYLCPEILSSQSRKTGWRIATVSLKPRNAGGGTPDAWEQKVIADFARRAANGEKFESLEFAETVSEPQSRYFRYAKAIRVERQCLTCHGSQDKLSDAVKAQLAIHYPFDRAVDFSVGQVYGIVSIKRDP